MERIEYFGRSVYGRDNLYIAGTTGELVERLTGKKTVSLADLADLADLAELTGAEIVRVVDPKVINWMVK